MASIRHLTTGYQHILSSSCLIGRSRVCSVRLDSRRVSAEHARLRWTARGWKLRDLNSLNGTFLDGQRLDPGTSRPVGAGARIAFGNNNDLFVLDDASPPIAFAQCHGRPLVYPEDGLIFLPQPDDFAYCLFEDGPGQWFIELANGDSRRVEDGEIFTCAGRPWRVSLPQPWEETLQNDDTPSHISEIGLRFHVSPNEEHVDLYLLRRGEVISMEPRKHAYLLLTLARLRLQDQSDSSLPEAEHGWIGMPELSDMLRAQEGSLNVEIHRARGQLRQLGILGATHLVERRRTSRQLRLGVHHCEII